MGMTMADRPMHPAPCEIVEQAYDAFQAWELKYADDLADVEDMMERTAIYGHWHAVGCIDLAKAMAAVDARQAAGAI